MKNKEDLKSLSVDQLKEKLAADSSALRNMKFAHAISPLENPMRIRHTRRNIARVQTELQQRNSASAQK